MKNTAQFTGRPILAALLICYLFQSCDKDKGPLIINPVTQIPVPPGPLDTIPEPTEFPYTISYNGDIKPLWSQNCVQACHNPQHPYLDLRPPVSYQELMTDGANAPYVDTISPEQSRLYLHLAGIFTLMPYGGPKLSQGKIDSVYTWIAQGAQNN